MCNVEELLKLTIFGAGIACAGSLMAEEKASVLRSEGGNWMQPSYMVSDNQDPNSFREQVQIRMRNLSQQEQKLMLETGFNGRDRVTAIDHGESGKKNQDLSNSDFGSSYGRGFESRQMQQSGHDAIGGGFNTGRATSIGGSQGKGR